MISYRHNYAALHYTPQRASRERRQILLVQTNPATASRSGRSRTTAPSADILSRIDRALKASGVGAAAFGREALGDPNLVAQLRAGRRIRYTTKLRIVHCLTKYETANGRKSAEETPRS